MKPIKVKGIRCYLYRAADKSGNTVDFLLTRRRQRMSAQSFLITAINNNCRPVVINIDKSGSNIIAVYEKKLSETRNLLVTEKIDAEDYNLMKIEYNAIISKLEKDIGNVEDNRASIEHLTTTGLENLLKLGEAFDGGTLADSRELIGLIFPENFTFQEKKIRTTRINETTNRIYLVNSRLWSKKTEQKMIFFFCPE